MIDADLTRRIAGVPRSPFLRRPTAQQARTSVPTVGVGQVGSKVSFPQNRRRHHGYPSRHPVGRVPYFLSSPSSFRVPVVRRTPSCRRHPADAAGGRDEGRPLRSARRESGVDPSKDVDITVRDGELTIKAEPTEQKEFNGRSEFSTARSFARCRCRRVPMRMTLRPPTTRASSRCRWRSLSRGPLKSTFKSSPPAESTERSWVQSPGSRANHHERKTTMGQEDSQLGVKRWSVIISIDEHDNSTEAKAHLYRPGEGLNGVGRAPFEADDRTPPSIVDELAAARALWVSGTSTLQGHGRRHPRHQAARSSRPNDLTRAASADSRRGCFATDAGADRVASRAAPHGHRR